jgi:large subunit ribosomal protein L17
MRHLNSGRKLGRTSSHRKATLSALSVSLIQHKRIQTTTAKAKEARMVVEKLITRAKRAVLGETGAKTKDIHARRVAFAYLRDRAAVTSLFDDIAPKVASRPGGYTRVVKLGQRRGDGAQVAVLELVDYNTGQEKKAAKGSEKKGKAPRKKQAKGTKKAKAGTTASDKAVKEKSAGSKKAGQD